MDVEDNKAQREPGQRRLVSFFSAIAADVGRPIAARATVLDFGCGDGGAVDAWRETGRDAFGCDLALERSDDRLRLIETPYRLPFDDATFDLVVSNMVLEHTQDLDAAFREIRRVLKPGAVSLHIFPARWTPIEPHTLVPLATVLQKHWWLALWARLGIRNGFQTGLPWREVAAFNVEYLRTRTSYATRKQLLVTGDRWFDDAKLADVLALKHGKRTRAVYPLARVCPPLAKLYGGLRTRLLILGRADAAKDASIEASRPRPGGTPPYDGERPSMNVKTVTAKHPKHR
jgi:SAM-dependent methyltransferase